MGKNIGASGVIAGAGLAVVAVGLYKCVEAAMESEKVTTETNAILQTTGATAWTTAGQIETLSGKIRDKTGFDDEQIQSAANMMLTFKDVQNRLGEGNDLFDKAVDLSADLARKFGMDVPQAAKQLGKALEDPITGVTALRRMGVQLTEQQKESIKTFMAQGDIASAQKVILQEVASQVGQVAEAYGTTLAGKIDIAKSKFGDMMETIGLSVIPKLTEALQDLISMINVLDKMKVPQILGEMATKLFDIKAGLQMIPGIGPIVNLGESIWNLGKRILGINSQPLDVKMDLDPLVADVQQFIGGLDAWKDASGRTTEGVWDLDKAVATLDADIKELTKNAVGVGAKIEKELALKGLPGVTKNDMIAVVHEITAAEPIIRDSGIKSMQALIDAVARSSPEMQANGSKIMTEFKTTLEQAAKLEPVGSAKVQEIINGLVAKYPELKPVADMLARGIQDPINKMDLAGTTFQKVGAIGSIIANSGAPGEMANLVARIEGEWNNLTLQQKVGQIAINVSVNNPSGVDIGEAFDQTGGYVRRGGRVSLEAGEFIIPQPIVKAIQERRQSVGPLINQAVAQPTAASNTYQININAGAYMGNPGDARRFATEIQKYLDQEAGR